MSASKSLSKLNQQLYNHLIKRGWRAEDILEEATISISDRLIRPDFILLYNFYPLAVIEVNSSRSQDGEKEAASQVNSYADALDLPFAFVAYSATHFAAIRGTDGLSSKLAEIPTPQHMWQQLGNSSNPETDPRISRPFQIENNAPKLYHAQATSRVIEAITNGQKRISLSMPQGSGRYYILSNVIWKLLQTGYQHRILFLTRSAKGLHQFSSRLHSTTSLQVLHLTEDRNRAQGMLLKQLIPKNSVTLISWQFFSSIVREGADSAPISSITPGLFDLVITDDLPGDSILQRMIDILQPPFIVAFLSDSETIVAKTKILFESVYTYSIEALIAAELEPPAGFIAVKLGDIAHIDQGNSLLDKTPQDPRIDHTEPSEQLITWIEPRNILPEGTINLADAPKQNKESVQLNKVINRFGLQANDIVMATYPQTDLSFLRIAYIKADFPTIVAISKALIRIRIKDTGEISLQQVSDFLRSDLGQSILRRFVAGTTQPRISLQVLKQIPIYIPESTNEPHDKTVHEPQAEYSIPVPAIIPLLKEFTAMASVLQQLESEVLPILRDPDIAVDPTKESDARRNVGNRLKQLVTLLLPPTLEENVLARYPMPIALAYQRFLRARFNPFEQVRRLIDLSESISFFVYNVLLADILSLRSSFYVEDKGARRAYNGYAMSARLDFVAAVQKNMQSRTPCPLFMPELIDSFDTQIAKQVQDQLRNRSSHSATAPEGQQRKLVATFQPQVEELLTNLDFLGQYWLIRIPHLFVRNRQMYRRMEIYNGITPSIDERLAGKKDQLAQVDSEHLALVNTEEKVLNLYPIFQLISSEETRYEPHICFLKQRKQKEQRLEGESIHGIFTLNLEGFNDFESLQANLLEKPPSS